MILDTSKFLNMIDHSASKRMYDDHEALVHRLTELTNCSKYDFWDMRKEYRVWSLLNSEYDCIAQGTKSCG